MLTRWVRSKVSAGMSRKAWKGQMPAFDTITSTRPKASTAFATKSLAVSGNATSPLTAIARPPAAAIAATQLSAARSEEHTSELQSLMRISYAVFCLKQQKKKKQCSQDKIY